jgi:hypothetical protein
VGAKDDGFHLEPPTQFEYGMDNADTNEETTVITKQTIDMVVEAGIKAHLSFSKIKEFIECMGSCSPVTNGMDKEGKNRKPVKLDKSQDYEEYPDDKGIDRFKDSIIDKGLKLGLAFSDIKNILEVAGSGNPSLNHTYPYESQGHVDAEKMIDTPWPQAHAGHDSDVMAIPSDTQEFRSPTKGPDGYVQNAKDPGKGKRESTKKDPTKDKPYSKWGDGEDGSGKKPIKYNQETGDIKAAKKKKEKKESIIKKALEMGLSFQETKKVLEYAKETPGVAKGADVDKNDANGKTPEDFESLNGAQADTGEGNPGKNGKMGEKTEKGKGGYENIGKKKNGAKKHGVTTKKKADAQRKAMFAHRKPGASWGK